MDKTKSDNEIPRRDRLDLMTCAERSLYDAMFELEQIGADPRLTEAGILLAKAKNLVSDFIDTPCIHDYKCTLDTDYWSSYKCNKCGYVKIVSF